MNSSLVTDTEQHFKPDLNTLTIYCDNKEVGIVKFDLTKFYNKKAEIQRANISAKKDEIDDFNVPTIESDYSHIYFEGFISFRVKCEDIAQQQQSNF